jgi:Undecaprenyl-phosphate glucose phosphotransferase
MCAAEDESASPRAADDPRSKSPNLPRRRFTSNVVGPIFLFTDILCLAVAAASAVILYDWIIGVRLIVSVHIFAFAVTAAAFIMMRSSRRTYQRTLLELTHGDPEAALDAVLCTLFASALVWQFGMIDSYSRGVNLLFLASLLVCLFGSRPLLRQLLARLAHGGAIEQRVAFYGADAKSLAMIRHLLAVVHLPHLKVLGVADDRPKLADLGDLRLLGGYAELTKLARDGELDQVIIAAPNIPKARLLEIVEGLSAVSIDVSVVPGDAITLAPDYRVHLLGSVPVLTLWQRPFRDINHFVKRGEDVLIAGFALVVLAPVLATAALLVRATSRGPALFVQPRIGFNNEVINVLKLRTMYADQSDVGARATTTRDDPRVTPIGRIFRKLSIDELPQLLNVLKGDMSLVGPRPHALEMKVGDKYYQEAVRGYAGRHRVKPGITGLAQVKGLRGEIRTIGRAKKRVELDEQYIDQWSIWLDLRILLLTVRAVVFDHDAY